MLRRLTVAAIITLVIATMLLTLPGARQAGATILASAGVLGIVAGLAAQSSLSNLFAGLQLAFTDAIRVDDVVVVEKEWGRIEEITLTYVVVHVWDDRRLILPSTYFTTTPFQNWTRKESAVLGAIDLDVDWRVPLDELRIELDRALRASELWDERVGILQVTDAVGSFVRLRVLVSGVDGPTVFDLRCEIREALVSYLQRSHAEALPRVRVEQVPRHIPTRPPRLPASTPTRWTWISRSSFRSPSPLRPRACSPAAGRRSSGPGISPGPAIPGSTAARRKIGVDILLRLSQVTHGLQGVGSGRSAFGSSRVPGGRR